MTTYNTGNPIGSTAVKDVYDNAENMDIFENDRTKESHPDRLGVPRKTRWGMEQDFQRFLINSGYENIGDYGQGLEITARNQIFWRDGELYRAGASLDLPYITTGDWGDEGNLFVSVGDAVLRQELANPVRGGGLVQVTTSTGEQTLTEALDSRAKKGLTEVRVESVSDLRSGSFSGINYIWLSGYYGVDTLGGGPLYRDESDIVTLDNGGSVFVDADGVRWKRPESVYVDVSEWGVSPDLEDNTSRYDAIISNVDEGSTIIWPNNKTIVGNFLSNKAFALDLNGSTLTNFSATDPVVRMSGTETQITTLTANASYGDLSLEMADATSLSAGDIIRIYDEKVRPSDNTPEINSEVLIVRSVSGNTVFVRDKVRSDQDVGVVTVTKIDPITNPSIKNGYVNPSTDHLTVAVFLLRAKNPKASHLTVTGWYSHAISVRHSVGSSVTFINCEDPIAVGDGQGYGIGVVFCRDSFISNIIGKGTRHTVDYSACYCCVTKNITSSPVAGASTCVTLAHNSFGGAHVLDGLMFEGGPSYVVVWSSQGVSNPTTYTARDVTIKNVSGAFSFDSPRDAYVAYIQTSSSNIYIENINVTFPEGVAPGEFHFMLVRAGGVVTDGVLCIKNLKSNRCTNVVAMLNDSNLSGQGLVDISSVHVNICDRAVWLRGQWSQTIGNISSNQANIALVEVVPLSEAPVVNDVRWGLINSTI